MKYLLLTILLSISVIHSYCETGVRVHSGYTNNYNYKYAIYSFNNVRRLEVLFYRNEMIPYTIRYNFYTNSLCR